MTQNSLPSGSAGIQLARGDLLATATNPGARLEGVTAGRVAAGADATADAWSNPTSLMIGLLAVTTTAFSQPLPKPLRASLRVDLPAA
ncbi:hypothetical protein [Streptomyces sp. NPDC058678]|uniref:hypothetical protein n=1 Tax=Streptomyces sp. NPDC058678 TaxID=3346595 RepID=UPI00364EC667